MTNQELFEAIAPYLPYDVKCKYKLKDDSGYYPERCIGDNICFATQDNFFWINEFEYLKPILHPLSDLTEPCLEGGKVPIVEIAKIIADIHNDDLDDKWTFLNNGRIIVKTPWNKRIEMYYKTESICWSVYDIWSRKELRTKNQLKSFQWLYKHHFDVEGLIEKGHAIDINTLSNDLKKL